MNINDANAPGLGVTGTTTNRMTTASPLKKNADINTFMTLLVAQLKNQDPLEPQQGSEFVAQLAQFNSLEQLININDRLNQLVNQQNISPTT